MRKNITGDYIHFLKLPGFKTAQTDFLYTLNSKEALKQSVKSGNENTAT